MKVIKEKKILKLTILFICLLAVSSSLRPGAPILAATDTGQPGPYPTTIRSLFNYTIFCPQTLGANDFKHPVITWGNGTFAIPSFYRRLLRHLAPYGFVVVCSNSINTGTGREMVNGIDLASKFLKSRRFPV
jgi:hypothetical protein